MEYIKVRIENKKYNFEKLKRELSKINCHPQCGILEDGETSYIDVFNFEKIEDKKVIAELKNKMREIVEKHDATPAPKSKTEMEEIKELLDALIIANLEVM